MPIRYVIGLALLSAGLLSGAFGYGAVNVQTTFNAVPLDVRLTFHTALMHMNGPVMQTTMALAVLSTAGLTVLSRGMPRYLAGVACLLEVASFLITRFGNIPINARIKVWAVTTPPSDYRQILDRWETFNVTRTVTAIIAFTLLVTLVARSAQTPRTNRRAEEVLAA